MEMKLKTGLTVLIFVALAPGALAQSKSAPCKFARPGMPLLSRAPRTLVCQLSGIKREALVYVPASGTKLPLLFAWHGHGGDMRRAAQQMHFQTLWPEAIVVYPQGLDTETKNDPEGKGPGWQKETIGGNRDLGFFDAMLTTLRQKYSVDDQRVYTTGFSNGTGFSYLLWVERGADIAAIGAVAGILADSEREKQMLPRALISIAGTGQGTAQGGVQQTIERARTINNAAGTGQQCPVPNGAH